MRIDFECSGGFANLHLKYHGDTHALPQEVREEFLRLIEDSEVFDIQPNQVTAKTAGPPDVFVYQLSLSEPGRKQSLSFNDVTAPPKLHPLLALLRQLALNQKLN